MKHAVTHTIEFCGTLNELTEVLGLYRDSIGESRISTSLVFNGEYGFGPVRNFEENTLSLEHEPNIAIAEIKRWLKTVPQSMLQSGIKIHMIKYVRAISKVGLKEAKDFVEKHGLDSYAKEYAERKLNKG